jgi:hypothetical protein
LWASPGRPCAAECNARSWIGWHAEVVFELAEVISGFSFISGGLCSQISELNLMVSERGFYSGLIKSLTKGVIGQLGTLPLLIAE